MKLCIISHTEHFKTEDGQIVGWGPTINEINHLTAIFDEIYHVAMLHKGVAPPSALPYTSSRIKFVQLPALGGKSVSSKLSTLWNAPKVISVVHKTMERVDYFQFRAPTGIGVYLIPYLTFFSKKKGWFKYAGNWNQENPPLGYALQRKMLKKQKRIVTINGNWPNQPSQCITFENPCLTEQDLLEGNSITEKKKYDNKLNFCFVGRLEHDKGVERIIKAITELNESEKQQIGYVDFVGEGKEISCFRNKASLSGVLMKFHGALAREEVFSIYKKAHVFLLPTTASEGFPKVIAEAMNFGCVPVVSNVSAISQYINTSNGYIVNPITPENLVVQLRYILNLDLEDYHKLINNAEALVRKFSFDHYNARIVALINTF